MAVDSKNKRASALTTGALAFLLVAPDPDGAFSQADRQHIAYSYRGILAEESSAVASPFRAMTDSADERVMVDSPDDRVMRA